MGKRNQQRRRAKAKTKRAAHRDDARTQAPGAAFASGPNGWPDTSEVQLALRVNELIGLAMEALDARRDPGTAVDRLTDLCRTGAGRRALVAQLAPALRSAVTSAWRLGWEPADLHRYAGRETTAAALALLLDCLADELQGYAPSTIDHRWWGQVAELGARVWWPARQNLLEARAETDGWDRTSAAGVGALHLLLTLPELEPLGPLPGAAKPATSRPSADAHDVDERILSRVRALLAKAESTTFEAEAETFTAGAQALMARHSIDAALLEATRDAGSGERELPRGRRIGINNPYEEPKAMLLAAVAAANRCRTVWSKRLGFVTVIGFGADLDAVETLFTSLLLQATRAMTREGSRRDGVGRSRTRAFRKSFLTAFAARIGERLREVTRSETDVAARSAARTTGQELVPVLAARDEAVEQAARELFPEMVQHRFGLGSDAEGWSMGRTAADLASIGTGAPVEAASTGT